MPGGVSRASLPACLLESGDHPRQGQFAQFDAADLELPQVPAAATGDLAPQARAGRAAVARELGERGEVLFLLELAADVGVLLDQRLAPLLLYYPGCRCHSRFLFAQKLVVITCLCSSRRGTACRTA